MAVDTGRSAPRRAAILAAALASFNDLGFEAATIEDVCERSGASVGSIYHHFGSKTGLASALFIEAIEGYLGVFVGILDRDQSTETTVKDLVRYHLRWVAEHPDSARFLFSHRSSELRQRTEQRLQELNRPMQAKLSAWLQARSSDLQPQPPELFLALLVSPVQEFARGWLSRREATSMREAERLLPAAIWRAVGRAPRRLALGSGATRAR